MTRNRIDLASFFIHLILFFSSIIVSAQSTSWEGDVSSSWKTAGNWTNGIPDATKDAIIGDGSFIGPNQPLLFSGVGAGTCKNLVIGNASITLTTVDDLIVNGNITILSNGTLFHLGGNITVQGNWANSGTYTPFGSNRRVYFSGTSQTISGAVTTSFERIYVNTGSTVTLARDISVGTLLDISGTFDPTETFKVTGNGNIDVNTNAILKVKAATYVGNYPFTGSLNLNTITSVVDYASSILAQTVNQSIAYRDLQISGTTTKSLAANTTVSSDLFIVNGTLDLVTFTLNRTASGGNLTMGNNTTLRIGGATTTFPANYTTRLLASSSTVQYYGGNQTVTAETYGHLILSSSGGAISKTMPGTAFTVAGNFTSSVSAGTLSYTAGNNISILGSVNIGASSTFNGSTFSHSISGNWVNNGAFNGCGGTLTSLGASSAWSGSGTNSFGNLVINGNGTTVNLNTSITVCGNFSTTGGGSFTHSTGGTGTFTMTGATRTISGSSIILDDLIMTLPASVTTTSTMTIAGDLTTTGTLTASSGTITFSGTGKVISGTAALQLAAVNVPGTITTARDISISSNFSVAGSFTATAGQITFNGTSTFSGTANLFNIRIIATGTLIMGASSTIGISGAETLVAGGVFNTTSNIPNTINYRGGAQSIVFTTFNNLIVSNGNTKTPLAGLTINGNFTISAATTFVADAFTHTVRGNWINSGTFTPGLSSTVQFTGSNDVTITGVTSFRNAIVNKTTGHLVTLLNSINVVNLTMTSGTMLTGANVVTITATRTGNGIIIGTITRTHAFGTGIDYAFEGPNNFINFSVATVVTSVTVTVTKLSITNFPSGNAINRRYTISITGIASIGTLRLHYEQSEINGNSESSMTLWTDGGIGAWVSVNKSAFDTGNDWVEQTGLIGIANNWTLSDGQNILSWTGASGTLWSDAGNWTVTSGSPGIPPTLNDIVQIGNLAFTNQPTITTSAQVKGITFGSTTASTLTLSGGGSLTVQGNIDGVWSTNRTHTINVGNGTLNVFSDLVLSDGTASRAINLTLSSGTVSVSGSLTQSGGAAITFTDAGNLNVSENYNYVSGAFTPFTGTVTYNGVTDQIVADHTYNHLRIIKGLGVASTNTLLTVNGNLQVSGGSLNVGSTLNVLGNVTVGVGSTLNGLTSTINVGGNWLMSGTFDPGSSTVVFNGTGAQSVDITTFNNVTVNKASGTLSLTGDLSINGDIDIQSGTVNVLTFNVSRTTTGGTATIGAGGTARFSGTGLQISNFSALNADAASTVEYFGATTRPIPPIAYGNLVISNTSSTMLGPTTVQGNLTINTGSTLVAPSSTLNLGGNLLASGTFNTSTGTLILNGTSKTINATGTLTYNNLVVNGSYDTQSGNVIFNGYLEISAAGDFDLGNATVLSHGDLTNSGILLSNGVVTFSGTQVQTLRLLNSISSTSTGVINFNGTVAPVLNSSASPVFATVNLNNSAPITASQPWIVGVAMNIATGSTWNAGPFTHTIIGNFDNNGAVNSGGIINFTPSLTVNVDLGNNFTSSGKIIFGGVGQLNLVDNNQTFASVDIANTNVAGITPSTGWTLTDDILIQLGSTLNGGTALTHTISGGWTNNGTFSGSTSTVILNSSTGFDELVGNGVNNFNNLTFAAGTSMNIVSSLAVSGNFTNNAASLFFQNGRVEFNGGSLSVIGGSTISNFDELEINKSASSVRMDLNATVINTFVLSSGALNLNAHSLTVTNPLNSAIIRTGGHVLSENTSNNSRLIWVIGNELTDHVFPFGTLAGVYIPFTFHPTSGDAGTVSLATYGTVAANTPFPPGVLSLNDALGANNSANVVDRFFQIDLSGQTSPTVDLTFSASAAEVGSITNLKAQRWNNGWDAPILGQSSAATSVTVFGVTQFSPWAISGNSVALPVSLMSFTAKQVKDKIDLEWVTASELNNDYFEIEKSLDAQHFFTIGRAEGAETTTIKKIYHFSDSEIRTGILYYRLKQVDFDKKFTYSKVVSVKIGDFGELLEFKLYPNPVVESISISPTVALNEGVSIALIDNSGRVILRESHQAMPLNEEIKIDVTSLTPGPYIVQIICGDYTKAYRITRVK